MKILAQREYISAVVTVLSVGEGGGERGWGGGGAKTLREEREEKGGDSEIEGEGWIEICRDGGWGSRDRDCGGGGKQGGQSGWCGEDGGERGGGKGVRERGWCGGGQRHGGGGGGREWVCRKGGVEAGRGQRGWFG